MNNFFINQLFKLNQDASEVLVQLVMRMHQKLELVSIPAQGTKSYSFVLKLMKVLTKKPYLQCIYTLILIGYDSGM